MKAKTITVNEEFIGQMREMMVEVFNDGCEQVIFPKFTELEEKIKESEQRVMKELREEFKRGQKSLGKTLEEVVRKVDQIAEGQKDDRRRLEKVERIVKAN